MSEFKYSFIYPVRNRAKLLNRGLQSLLALDYDLDNFEVVIADYLSTDNLVEVIHSFRGRLNIKYLCIDFRRYKFHNVSFKNGNCNPALAQNVAVACSEGKHIILTSPEIIHWKQNLNLLDKIDNLENKMIYGRVVELSESSVFNNPNPFDKLNSLDSDKVLCDWEHTLESPTLYFIGVIPRKIYRKYGGIDEYYMTGIAYDDEDFGNRLKRIPELKLVYDKNIFGVHLTHDRSYQDISNILSNKEYMEKKQNSGWENHLISNKDIKPGDFDVIIEHSQFWRF